MIGLVVLAAAAGWLFVCAKIAHYVALKSNLPHPSLLLGIFTFVAVALLPFIDEIIGRRQFQHLCASEATVWVSPHANMVVAAREAGGFSERNGLVFPVREQAIRYTDAATDEIFYSVKAFHTPGGMLMRAGLGLGNSTSCWPEKWSSGAVGLDIDLLLKRGQAMEPNPVIERTSPAKPDAASHVKP